MQWGHIEIMCVNTAVARHFYETVLGCTVTAVQGDHIWLQLGKTEILLRPGTPPTPATTYQAAATGCVLYTNHLEETAAVLTERGLQFSGTDGSDHCLTFQDPDGHWFQLVNPESH